MMQYNNAYRATDARFYLAQVDDLEKLLIETEKAHAASGDSAEGWARWYAAYLAQRGVKR